MKKYLLGTTALVAAGLMAGQANAADKFAMGVGGFMEQFFGFMSNEGAVGQDFGHFNNGSNEAEIHFKGTMLLNNGIKVAARVELETNEDAQNVSVDEVWLQLSSDSLGLLVIGSDDMPSDGIKGVPKVGIGLSDVDNWVRDLNISGGSDSEGASVLGDSGDHAKLVYYTPVNWQKEWGIQFAGGIMGNTTNANTEGAFVENSTSGFAYNVTASYSRRFGEVDTYVAAGYYRQVDEKQLADANGGGDLNGYQLALNLKWGPWELGGGYQRTFDDLDKKTSAELIDAAGASSVLYDSIEGWSMNAGIAYTLGAWQFGLAYGYGEIEGAINTFGSNGVTSVGSNGKDRRNTVEAATKYDFGNGLDWRTSLVYAKYHNGDVVAGVASNSSAVQNDQANNDEGWALVTGFTLTF